MIIKYFSQKLLLTFIISIMLLNTSFLFAQDKKKILFISSYHPSFPTFFQQIDGIKSILNDVQIDVEFMDSKRFDYNKTDEMFSKKLKWKLSSLPKYDAIITADDNALTYLLKHKEQFFPDIPAVFLGVNDIDKALLQNMNPSVTGVVEAVSMLDTLKLMDKLHINAEKIIAISDDTYSGKENLNQYKKLSETFPNKKLDYISLEDYNFNSFWKKLAQINKNNPVLLLSAYLDKDANRMNFEGSLSKIKQHLKAPLYHLWFHGMENGIIGGKLISHYHQGKSAGEIVLDILNGKDISKIKVKTNSPNKYFFDYLQLKQFDIKISNLPKESIVLNKPISFYEENKTFIWSIILFIIFLFMIILIILLNIVKRKEAEKELKITNEKLDEKKKELEMIIQEAPNPIILFQDDGKILMLNQAWINSSGYSLDDIPTIDDLVNKMYKDTEMRISFKEHIKALFSITQKVDGGKLVFLNKFGKNIILQFSSAPLGLIDGKQTVISSGIDITELEYKEDMLRQQSKMAAMGEMLENIAHQWRQPLSIISTTSSGIKFKNSMNTLEDSEINESMENINNSVQHLSQTIDDFRNFFKPNKKKDEFTLKSSFEKTFKLIESQLINANIMIIKDIKDVRLIGFENELIQVLINILNNARDELIKKEQNVKIIKIDSKIDNNVIEVYIKDNAGGISDDIINAVFESHFSTKHETDGTGIGLYMSKMILEEHFNGKIEAQNINFVYEQTSYSGAEFKICLPLFN